MNKENGEVTNHTTSQIDKKINLWKWLIGIAFVSIAWLAIYSQLIAFANTVVNVLGLQSGTQLAEAVRFFVYDTPKVLLLLIGIVFVMGVVQTFFSPERTRALLSGKRLGVGNLMAASLGIVTPFCSCSAVPLFIGFLSAGVPMGITFSFLISAPMINEVALVLLFGMFGFRVAGLYLLLGISVAIVAGYVIGVLKLEKYLEDWVRAIQVGESQALGDKGYCWIDRFQSGITHVRKIVGKVWLFVVAGIALGALIHGYVPQDFMVGIMGKDAPWWSVPAAVFMGVPMYTNAAGIIPIVESLISKGAALGTVLAFMMSVIALSAPEIIILRKVLKPQLIAIFVGTVAIGILIVGYVFNEVL